MAITIDWGTKIINVPKADTTLLQSVPTEIRELNLNTFRLILKDLEDSEEGMTYPATHNHNPPVTVGGVTLARVIEIINGYTILFEDGQYAVNLVGANSNAADVTIVNQVSIRTSNSAGLVQAREVEQASFEGTVHIDAGNVTGRAVAGTAYPIGTLQQPVNNLADAQFIANLRGLDSFHILGNLTIGATDDVSEQRFYGEGASLNVARTTVTFTAGCNTLNSHWHDAKITGYQDGETFYNNCTMSGLRNAHCTYSQCGLADGTGAGYTIRQNAGTSPSHTAYFKECYSDEGTAIIDRNGSGVNMSFDDFNGRIKFINQNHPTQSGQVWIHLRGGTITIDSSCTTGTITVTGFGVLDNQTGGTVVDATGFLSEEFAVVNTNIAATSTLVDKVLKLAKVIFARM